jgi:tubulin-like protein CetZ
MKLSVIGLGQAGGNIADAFYAVNEYAESLFNRRVEILVDAFAINTDEADLQGFSHIPKDKSHRIVIGNLSTFGHGVGKINTTAAEIIKSSNSTVTDSILRSARFHESDAVIAISSGGGGTGSGMIGWLIKSLKERVNKPIYAVIVLPFAFEEQGETSLAVMNSAVSINTAKQYADAVFLIDNERYRKAGTDLSGTLHDINQEIAGTFYDLCCAGEERNSKFIGGKVLDAGDIKQSLEGLTVIGKGQVNLPSFRWFLNSASDASNSQKALFGALTLAEENSSLSIKLEDARKILVLVTAPKDVITVNALEEITSFLQGKCPEGIIRIGDYPRRSKDIVVTLIGSQLTKVPRLESLFEKAIATFKKKDEIKQETMAKIDQMYALGGNLPRLD